MKTLFHPLLLCVCIFLVQGANALEISLSFDDAPRSGTPLLSQKERAKKLVGALKKVQVKEVVFFCNTQRLSADAHELKPYIDAGHLIANHTHSHPWIDKVSTEFYKEDISKAHEVLSKLKNFIPWFRFPFLHEGKTLEKRDAIRAHLENLGYRNGYVTIDTYDWYMQQLLDKALEQKKKVDYKKLGDMYVEVILKSTEFFNSLADKTLKKPIKHTLLLHENDLAALYIDQLVGAVRSRGGKIITPTEAYSDQTLMPEPSTLLLNQGRIAAYAKIAGSAGPFSSPWEDEAFLDKYFADQKVFQ